MKLFMHSQWHIDHIYVDNITLEDMWSCWHDPNFLRGSYVAAIPDYGQPARVEDSRLAWVAAEFAGCIRHGVNQVVRRKMEDRKEPIPAWSNIPAAMRDGLNLNQVTVPVRAHFWVAHSPVLLGMGFHGWLEPGKTHANLFTELRAANWDFELEVLPTGHVNADCCNKHGQLASILVPPNVAPNDLPKELERLVERAHRRWVGLGRPQAASVTFEGDELIRLAAEAKHD